MLNHNIETNQIQNLDEMLNGLQQERTIYNI